MVPVDCIPTLRCAATCRPPLLLLVPAVPCRRPRGRCAVSGLHPWWRLGERLGHLGAAAPRQPRPDSHASARCTAQRAAALAFLQKWGEGGEQPPLCVFAGWWQSHVCVCCLATGCCLSALTALQAPGLRRTSSTLCSHRSHRPCHAACRDFDILLLLMPLMLCGVAGGEPALPLLRTACSPPAVLLPRRFGPAA